jgi:hypothetical protein
LDWPVYVTTENQINKYQLALTVRGATWLNQFESGDRETAKALLAELTLISHNEFERALTSLIIAEGCELRGPVALYATPRYTVA